MSIQLPHLLGPNKQGKEISHRILSFLDQRDIARLNTASKSTTITAKEATLARSLSLNSLSWEQWQKEIARGAIGDFTREFTSLQPVHITINKISTEGLQQFLTLCKNGEIQSRFPNVSSLKFSSVLEEPIGLTFLRYCPRLKSLVAGALSITSLEPLAQTKLEWLDISHHFSLDGFRYLPSTLKTLIARDIFSLTSRDLETIVQQCPDLEELDLESCIHISSLEPIAQLTKLRALNIPCNNFHERDLEYLPSTLKSLKARGLSDMPIATLAKRCPDLEELDVCCNHSLLILKPMAQFTKLRILNISFREIFEEELSYLPKGLIHLEVDSCGIGNRGIEHIAALPNLKRLNIGGNTNIIDLRPLENSQLEELDLTKCYSILDFSSLRSLPLRILGVSFRDFEDRHWDSLGNLTQLQVLDLMGEALDERIPITQNDMQRLYRLNHLEYLTIYERPQITAGEICAIFPKLQTLALGWKHFDAPQIRLLRKQWNRNSRQADYRVLREALLVGAVACSALAMINTYFYSP